MLFLAADIICTFCLFLVDQANRDYGPPPPVPPPPSLDAYSSYRGLALQICCVHSVACVSFD